MPLGFSRLNERTQRPNPLINFIKPLPGPTSDYALDFLSRIAAISHPIMAKNTIAVMSLEEYAPNPEFIGRNFNAGEVIQLVLKDRSGRWLPFRHVQLVMMHELAHCKQMNHSRAFWGVRDAYAKELRGLWERGYTGDGMWGRGRTLVSKEYERDEGEEMDIPENLCGGTYRTGRRKRRRGGKAKEELSYAERKQRRILKKFGTGGTALGDDERRRKGLEGRKPAKGKPRVAGSARGRELRAAAALARFDQAKKEEVKIEDSDSSSNSDNEDYASPEDTAVDLDGKAMTDSKGHGLVKICEGEDTEDDNAAREMAELYVVDGKLAIRQHKPKEPNKDQHSKVKLEKATLPDVKTNPGTMMNEKGATKPLQPSKSTSGRREHAQLENPPPSNVQKFTAAASDEPYPCPICSLFNPANTLTCVACAHVLNTQLLPNNWKCQSTACQDSANVNSGDSGVCGVCGEGRLSRK